MKQITKEMKSVFKTGYNLPNNEYWIEYGYPVYIRTKSRDYACYIRDGDFLLAKIKYWNKKDPSNYEWFTKDKNTKKTIKNCWVKYA